MEVSKRLPKSFFEKPRKIAPKDSLEDVTHINWSKEVMSGKKKVIVTLPEKKSNK